MILLIVLFKIELFNDTEALDDDLDKSRDKELLSMGLRFSFGDDDDDDDDDNEPDDGEVTNDIDKSSGLSANQILK